MEQLNSQGACQSSDMRYTSFDHPAVDLLERFAMNRCSEEELELVEAHFLACDSCVGALESLEIEIAATRLALEQLAAEKEAKLRAQAQSSNGGWRTWFTFQQLSWAGAGLAACAFCVFTFIPAHLELQARRGTESAVIVPEWRPTMLTLRDQGLQDGPVHAELVDENGNVTWKGTALSQNGSVDVHLPRITSAGRYYARVYTPGEHELLSEFPFDVKFKF